MSAFAAAALAVLAAAHAPQIAGADPETYVATRACAGLAERVDAIPGNGPVLLRSYDAANGRSAPTAPALQSAAFSYDNALATIALIACGRTEQAFRLGAALRDIADSGRVRNAYRAGAVENAKPLPNGWWDAAAKHWREDAYQDGSATGNAAWVAIALLQLDAVAHQRAAGEAATRLAGEIAARTRETGGPGGFSGGTLGFDTAPQRIVWRSTEHNIDLIALFDLLAKRSGDGAWQERERHARDFVAAMWDAPSGHFWIGTREDGITPNRDTSALDVQLWAQLLPQAAPDWHRAVAYAEASHAVDGGFDFNADRDGAWLEGTAQAALVYRRSGRDAAAQPLLATLAANFPPRGLLFATREARITTGLAAGTAAAADFYYYRLPHVGATAWAALAALDFNPFVAGGRR